MNSRIIIPFTRLLRSALTLQSGSAALDVLQYGDGGVDVTGVPNCFEAEGAAKRRVFTAFFRKLNIACWGLQFFSHLHAIKLVLGNVNKVLIKITDVITLVKQILIAFFCIKSLPNYFLLTNFTNLLSSHFFLDSVILCGEVNTSAYPKCFVPSDLKLSPVSSANQSNENVAIDKVVLFKCPLCWSWENHKLKLKLKLLTDTWQSYCANLLKSRKDTPRNFLIHAQLAAFFIREYEIVRHET